MYFVETIYVIMTVGKRNLQKGIVIQISTTIENGEHNEEGKQIYNIKLYLTLLILQSKNRRAFKYGRRPNAEIC